MQLRLTLRSDATFGRGDGVAGLVDTEVEHDLTTGLPYLRGRTLKGLLVEECANLLYGLDEGGANGAARDRLRRAAQFLFGGPGSGLEAKSALHVGNARLPETLRKAVAADVDASRLNSSEVLDVLTSLRRQTAIDDATGAPQEGTLRSTRVVGRGLAFYAPLRFGRSPTDDALALLAACARSLRRGGTARNRGRGRLRLRLFNSGPNEEDARSPETRAEDAEELTNEHFGHFSKLARGSDRLSAAQAVDAASPARRSAAPEQGGVGADPDDPPGAASKTLVYRVELEQPVLATAVEGDPNSSVSSDYLPGSALRGALIARYQQQAGADDLANSDRARRLFFDGRTRFLNAYPVVRDEYGDAYATRPTPLSYYRKKGEKKELHDFALSSPPSDDETDDETQWNQARTPFQAPMQNKLHLEQPERHVTVHNQRDRWKGRATEESGELFRYDALAPTQTFEAAICCDTAADVALLKELLEAAPALQIGGARSAGYGEATLAGPIKQPAGTWREHGTGPPPSRDDERVVFVLQSHALVRDAHGQFTVEKDVLAGAVNRALRLEGKERLRLERAFVRGEVTGGFNRKWNLPLLQALAAKMGSVLVLERPAEAPGDLDERLAALEREGIGERRAEGFGRVAVNRYGKGRDLSISVRDQDEESSDGPPAVSTGQDSEAHALAQRMADRLLRRRLDLALVEKAGQVANINFGKIYERGNEPTPSQLGRLREAFRNALQAPSERRDQRRGNLTAFLDDLPPNAQRQLKTGTFGLIDEHGTGTLWEWLHERAASTQNPLLQSVRGDAPKVGKTAEAEPADEALAREYNLRLAHGVLARAAKVYKRYQ